MPFIPNTPESLIGRSDSKNPATTCRGITSGGRPCRRPLNSSSPASSPAASPRASRSRVQQLRVDDPRNPDLYCWQHRDQASSSARSSPGPASRTTPILETRESFDSLVGRLGIVEAERKGKKKPGRSPAAQPNEDRRNEKASRPQAHTAASKPPSPKPKPKTKQRTTFCCCFTIPVKEEVVDRPARPRPRPLQSTPATPASASLPSNSQRLSNQRLSPSYASQQQRPSVAASSRHSSAVSTVSQTSQYLSLIPPAASPQTASQLLAELARPVSAQDEPGYIYIFWLTPESAPAPPPADAARDLLAPPPSRPDTRQRRTSDVLQSFATAADEDKKKNKKKTVLLKIGRASNVQRRLNEWSRQCGHDLSLIRYYPYISSSASHQSLPAAAAAVPRKMPHSHKVERLVHLELAGLGLRVADRANCAACGRAHREWFEVEASRAGIAAVDEVVRRWSDWDEGRGLAS
ncbi:meiotically up-regulated gene 113-domain-containing protein [Xylariaceae sp. FL0804]|nr:meiotically up-regulated gene 113-domain-containing protein [Xylariaceae sp. FL0804]